MGDGRVNGRVGSWILCVQLGAACGDAGGNQGTDSASGGQTSTDSSTGAPLPTTGEAMTSTTSGGTDSDSLTGDVTGDTDESTGVSASETPTTSETTGGCPPDSESCDGDCVDTDTDPANCGGCGVVCDAGLSCVAGECLETEVCDGIDNDEDRAIDEGFPDVDGDAVADCVDDACAVDVIEAAAIPVDETCVIPDITVEDPWNAVIKYQYKDNSQGSYTAPVVGNVTDDNMDGVIDELDDPDVAFVNLGGQLVVVEPATGTVHWTRNNTYNQGSVAIADVDADGRNEVLAYDSVRHLIALDGATGTLEWTSIVTDPGPGFLPTVADIDADGAPEVVFERHVIRGADGSLIRTYPVTGFQYWGPVVADLDLDGDQEIIVANQVHELASDVPLWSTMFTGAPGPWSMIVDADGDPEAEVVMVGRQRLGVWNHDGSEIFLTDDPNISQPGPPCAADFDGDGAVEVAWISGLRASVYELDGTKLWDAPVQDGSGLTGCSAFDFDADGAYEMIAADQQTFFIFDGATGMVRFKDEGHASGTVWEYPTVADIDNDGSAEVLFVSQGVPAYGTLTVLGHAAAGWPSGGRAWGNHAFAVTNLLPDGHVPTAPAPWWQIFNVFRGRPPADDGATDLRVLVADACVSSCGDNGSVTLVAQVENHGAVEVGAGVPLTLYRKDGDMLEVVQTIVLDAAIAGGSTTAGLPFTLPLTAIGVDGLVLRVDDDGLGGSVQGECDEANNEVTWVSPC